ncbi:biotin/lipoyl-binding protein, partial [Moorena sp. SIO3H5]|uniref:HlyD family secretion protein n=1 Tax=Moorena sp. SIO3H5 TaxID=2607834 RepID=UPI0013BD855F
MAFQANQPWADFNFGKNRLAKWLLRLLLLCLVLGGGYAAYRQRVILPNQQAKTQMQTVSVEKLNLAITVSANGVIEPERAINLSPKTTGLLKTLLVKEGDRVQKGQILAYMDDSNLTGQLTQAEGQLAERQANLQKLLAGNRREDIAQAQAQLAEAQANLEKLLAGNRREDIAQGLARLEKAQANLQEADDDLQRNQELATAGAISVKEFNQARTARDTAEAGVNEAKQALLLLKAGARPEDIAQARARVMQRQQSLKLAQAGARPEDIAQARARVMQAEGAVQNAKAQIADTVIRAPFTGIVARKYADPG